MAAGGLVIVGLLGTLFFLLASKKEETPALPDEPAKTPPGMPPARTREVEVPKDPGEIGPPPGRKSPGWTESRNQDEILAKVPEPYKSQVLYLLGSIDAPGALKAAAAAIQAAGYTDAAKLLSKKAAEIEAAAIARGEPPPMQPKPPLSSHFPPEGWPTNQPWPPPPPTWWGNTQSWPPIAAPQPPPGWFDWLAWPPAPPEGWPMNVPFPIPPTITPSSLLTMLPGVMPSVKTSGQQSFPGSAFPFGYPTPIYGPVKGDGSDVLFQIAKRITGDQARWPELCLANPQFPKHPTLGCIYSTGDMLNLPDEWVMKVSGKRYPRPPASPGDIDAWGKSLVMMSSRGRNT